jgi:hypothetical protein
METTSSFNFYDNNDDCDDDKFNSKCMHEGECIERFKNLFGIGKKYSFIQVVILVNEYKTKCLENRNLKKNIESILNMLKILNQRDELICIYSAGAGGDDGGIRCSHTNSTNCHSSAIETLNHNYFSLTKAIDVSLHYVTGCCREEGKPAANKILNILNKLFSNNRFHSI